MPDQENDLQSMLPDYNTIESDFFNIPDFTQNFSSELENRILQLVGDHNSDMTMEKAEAVADYINNEAVLMILRDAYNLGEGGSAIVKANTVQMAHLLVPQKQKIMEQLLSMGKVKYGELSKFVNEEIASKVGGGLQNSLLELASVKDLEETKQYLVEFGGRYGITVPVDDIKTTQGAKEELKTRYTLASRIIQYNRERGQ